MHPPWSVLLLSIFDATQRKTPTCTNSSFRCDQSYRGSINSQRFLTTQNDVVIGVAQRKWTRSVSLQQITCDHPTRSVSSSPKTLWSIPKRSIYFSAGPEETPKMLRSIPKRNVYFSGGPPGPTYYCLFSITSVFAMFFSSFHFIFTLPLHSWTNICSLFTRMNSFFTF